MTDLSLPARDSVEAQRELFRLAEKECGLSISVIAARSPLKASTMQGWRDGSVMPVWALGALGAAGVPDHLLSLIMAPYGKHVGTDECGDGDLDALGRESAGYVSEKLEAESDGIVTPIEKAQLKERALRITCVARKAAAA